MRLVRYAAWLVVILLAAFTYPGAVAVSMAVRLSPPPVTSSPPPPGALPWLHVAHPANARAYIADRSGRMVLLHGATPASLIDFWTGTDQSQPDVPALYPIDPAAYADGRCPSNSPRSRYPPLCQSDIQAMAALGFNSVRLPVSWSLLEPQRGQFSQTYLERVAQVVDWARAAGMYVIVDMHQNAYSRYVGAGPPTVDLSYLSGAPKWATYTDGFPSHVFQSQRELNPAVFEAATNFWYDRAGIQDEYVKTVAFIAARFKDDSTVAGYSLFNEPWPGWNLPPGFEDLLLFPFYRRVIDAITGVRDGLPCWTGFFMPAPCGYPDLGVHDVRHLVFVDMGLLREVTDFPTHLGLPLSSYPNVVLSLHAYTHVYTVDSVVLHETPRSANYPWGGFDQSYSLAEREARTMNAALFVGEFGDDPSEDSFELASQLEEIERHALGFAFWNWKENGGTRSWGMFDPPSTPAASSGCLRAARERMLAQVYPSASADPAPAFHYASADGSFRLAAHGRPGDAPTVVVIPPEVTGAVGASGGVTIATLPAPGGGRLVTAAPSGGDYTVSVAAAGFAPAGCQ